MSSSAINFKIKALSYWLTGSMLNRPNLRGAQKVQDQRYISLQDILSQATVFLYKFRRRLHRYLNHKYYYCIIQTVRSMLFVYVKQ